MNYITINIPEAAGVLILEDSPMRIAWFKKRLPSAIIVKTVQELKEYFASKPVCDFYFLDHDLGEGAGNGVEAAIFLKERFGIGSNAAVIHTWNTAGAARMKDLLPRAQYIPFGEFEIDYASQ
jgi:hypothetical protein